MSGCYAAIIGGVSLCVGQPVVHEPGSGKMRLKDAVAFLRENAAGADAWVVKVTGDVTHAPNALIPSTSAALTHGNYGSRAARHRAKSRKMGFAFDWLYQARKETGNSTLFTNRIEAGVVAWPTWLMIQALPQELRKEYENLEVETVLFYPSQLVAADGPAYDALVDGLASDRTPWSSTIDMKLFRQVVVERIGEEHAALRFPLGQLAQKIAAQRRQARDLYGKGSGAELAWKQQGNTVYGVTACRHLATNSVVTANVITATGRAIAYGMQMALNGYQVITDGCTYRRDQVPAGTFADCLARRDDYPVNRTGFQGPFLDTAAVPADDAAFTQWYRSHVKRFFGVSAPEYDQLFGLHALEHKKCGDPERTFFDGLCCDGSANYVKLAKEDDDWKVLETKARSYRKEAKERLAPWIVETYSTDNYQGPPPLTESVSLLSYQDAARTARIALEYLEGSRDADEDECSAPFG